MTKEEILEATLKLASQNGLGNISMSQIADEVHLKKSSLYSHFRSKEDLIENMYEYFRSRAKQHRGQPEIDYDVLFAGRSFAEILETVVEGYRQINRDSDLALFYRLIMAERVYDPLASTIMVDETKRMIRATRNLFYALMAKKIVDFSDPDAAALSFTMGVHAIMDYEADAANAGTEDAKGAMTAFIREFARIYEGR